MIRALGWTLLHFVWQGAAVAALLASANLVLRRSAPQVRYLLACAGLVAMLALPAVTFRVVSSDALALGAAPFARVEAPASVQARAASPAIPGPALDLDGRVEAILPALVALWGSGVLLLGMQSLGGLALVRRLGRAGLTAPPHALQATLARLSASLRVSAPVRLYESALVGVPTVVGFLRPAILLPASALSGLTAHQLELILAHELAHVRRHDYLVNLLQSAAETLLFYHPAVWWVSGRMRVEREHCCDDTAVAACGSAVRYARALVELEGLCADAPAFAMAANGGSLVERVMRLVGRAPEPSRAARGLAALAAVAGVALALGLGSILLDRPTPTVGSVLAATRPVASVLPEPAPLQETAAPKAAATPRPQAPAAKPQSSKLPAAVGSPQPRAFPLETVLEMARAGITPGYVDEMDALGYKSVGAEQLIALRQQGVGPDYVRELAELGYKELSVEQLLGLRAQGVSPDFVKGLRAQGLQDLSLSDLLALRAQGVTPDYVAKLKAAGRASLSVTSLLSLRGQGVSGDYVAELKALGYDSLSEPQLLALRSQGVSPGYVRELATLGYRGLDVRMLLALRSQGVTPDYVRELKQAGFDKLPPEELITLRSQGVSARLLKSMRARQQP